MKSYRTTIILAAGLFLLDAFVLNQGFVALLIVAITLCVFIPRALWAFRKNHRVYLQRLTKAGIYLLAAFSVFAANALQNRIADHRAIALGNACLAYRLKYQHYPENLEKLVPEFMASVPLAKPLSGAHFSYYAPAGGGMEPMLFYQALPPFGRRFYHMEKHYWGYMD
jgi:hypothetical protein